ncbi:hypothetical protein NHX12_003247 [Muraenolepis orangiensis]|uniref:Uncharacterized protein n=1 Tax=Muraenolepis orangiensis TaxID=630683 RepID=A0A9Q0IDV4_9TELE|nr:hypothetical protein NHX12_003247 [Muraenolepis orangiensis]
MTHPHRQNSDVDRTWSHLEEPQDEELRGSRQQELQEEELQEHRFISTVSGPKNSQKKRKYDRRGTTAPGPIHVEMPSDGT